MKGFGKSRTGPSYRALPPPAQRRRRDERHTVTPIGSPAGRPTPAAWWTDTASSSPRGIGSPSETLTAIRVTSCEAAGAASYRSCMHCARKAATDTGAAASRPTVSCALFVRSSVDPDVSKDTAAAVAPKAIHPQWRSASGRRTCTRCTAPPSSTRTLRSGSRSVRVSAETDSKRPSIASASPYSRTSTSAPGATACRRDHPSRPRSAVCNPVGVSARRDQELAAHPGPPASSNGGRMAAVTRMPLRRLPRIISPLPPPAVSRRSAPPSSRFHHARGRRA